MTIRKTALDALAARLATTGRAVERNTAVPVSVPTAGLIILADGNPGEPDVLMSPITYIYDHAAVVEVFAAGTTPAGRAATLDATLAAIGAALAADRTLGGAVTWAEPGAPDVEDVDIDGGHPIAAATLRVILQYFTTDPLA